MTSTHANSAVSALSATSFQADAGKVAKAPKTEAGREFWFLIGTPISEKDRNVTGINQTNPSEI